MNIIWIYFSQNVFFGVGGAVFSCVGDWTSAKQRGLLCLTVSILIMNIVNLIILEIGEWRYLTPESVKDSMSREGLETLILYGNYCCFLFMRMYTIIYYNMIFITQFHLLWDIYMYLLNTGPHWEDSYPEI